MIKFPSSQWKIKWNCLFFLAGTFEDDCISSESAGLWILFTPQWEDALTDRQTAAAASLSGRIIRHGGFGSCRGSCTISQDKATHWQIGLIQLEGKTGRKSKLGGALPAHHRCMVCLRNLFLQKKKNLQRDGWWKAGLVWMPCLDYIRAHQYTVIKQMMTILFIMYKNTDN